MGNKASVAALGEGGRDAVNLGKLKIKYHIYQLTYQNKIYSQTKTKTKTKRNFFSCSCPISICICILYFGFTFCILHLACLLHALTPFEQQGYKVSQGRDGAAAVERRETDSDSVFDFDFQTPAPKTYANVNLCKLFRTHDRGRGSALTLPSTRSIFRESRRYLFYYELLNY